MLSDIYQNGKFVDDKVLYDKLTHKAGFTFQYKKIKKSIPNSILRDGDNDHCISEKKMI